MSSTSLLDRRGPALVLGFCACVALASGCLHRDSKPPTDRIATYRGGEVSIGEAEEALRRSAATANRGLEELVSDYRIAAESVVAERLLVPEKETAQIFAALGEAGVQIRRQVSVAAYLAPRLGDLRLKPGEVEAFYAEHRERFHRDAQRYLWHIFRRHRDAAHPEETLAALADLKRRTEAGESFAQLARDHSESETRGIGGRLGLIRTGRLPQRIEDVVFALPADSVSAPIPVPGGATLFYVGDVIEERDFPLEDVRPWIAEHLVERARRERIARLLEGREPPAGSTVLSREELLGLLPHAEPQVVILAVGDFRLTVGELERSFTAAVKPEPSPLDPSPQERLLEMYENQKNEQLLYLAALETDLAPAQQKVLEERQHRLGREALVRERFEERMRKRASRAGPEISRFFEDNRHLYQSALRFKLRSLTVDANADAPRKLADLAHLRVDLNLGQTDLETVAAKVGGRVEDLGWIDSAAFQSYESKIRYYVVELNGTGFTVPFQVNRKLCIIWVEKREEPEPLPFETVRDRVAADYFDRHHQQLYRASLDDLLREVDFRFDEAVVRTALEPPAQGALPRT